MVNFEKTTKTEKIIIAILTLVLIAGLAVRFVQDKGFTTKNLPKGPQLISPITDKK